MKRKYWILCLRKCWLSHINHKYHGWHHKTISSWANTITLKCILAWNTTALGEVHLENCISHFALTKIRKFDDKKCYENKAIELKAESIGKLIINSFECSYSSFIVYGLRLHFVCLPSSRTLVRENLFSG